MDLKSLDLNKLKIIKYPDPLLRKVAVPIEEITAEVAALADRMIDIMVEAEGVGLAASQIGVPLRLIVVSLTAKRDQAEVLINPELSDFQGMSDAEEGCLSVPGVRAKVRRSLACRVTAQDLDGNRFVIDAADLSAIVMQHETDHLDGKLFIDRLGMVSRMSVRRSLKQLEQEYKD